MRRYGNRQIRLDNLYIDAVESAFESKVAANGVADAYQIISYRKLIIIGLEYSCLYKIEVRIFLGSKVNDVNRALVVIKFARIRYFVFETVRNSFGTVRKHNGLAAVNHFVKRQRIAVGAGVQSAVLFHNVNRGNGSGSFAVSDRRNGTRAERPETVKSGIFDFVYVVICLDVGIAYLFINVSVYHIQAVVGRGRGRNGISYYALRRMFGIGFVKQIILLVEISVVGIVGIIYNPAVAYQNLGYVLAVYVLSERYVISLLCCVKRIRSVVQFVVAVNKLDRSRTRGVCTEISGIQQFYGNGIIGIAECSLINLIGFGRVEQGIAYNNLLAFYYTARYYRNNGIFGIARTRIIFGFGRDRGSYLFRRNIVCLSGLISVSNLLESFERKFVIVGGIERSAHAYICKSKARKQSVNLTRVFVFENGGFIRQPYE